MTQGPETCNTYNMLRLTKLLYQVDGGSNYMDYYEKRFIITSCPHKTARLVALFILPHAFRALPCLLSATNQLLVLCGSGLENHARYGEMIYAIS